MHDDCMNVVSEHVNYLMQSGINVEDQHASPPSFYWLPKVHVYSRFIVTSNKCTTKQLSLFDIITHFKQYREGIYRDTGVNCFWIIEKSKVVLDRLRTINDTSTAKSSDSYDFASLYINIPHAALKNELMQEACKVRGAKYLIYMAGHIDHQDHQQ